MKNIPLIVFAALCMLAFIVNNEVSVIDNYRYKTVRAQEKLADFRIYLAEAHANAMFWANWPGQSESKQNLRVFVDSHYPSLRKDLLQLEKDSAFPVNCKVSVMLDSTDQLVKHYSEIMTELNSFESYDNATIVFYVRPMIMDADGDCVLEYNRIKSMSDQINLNLRKQAYEQLLKISEK